MKGLTIKFRGPGASASRPCAPDLWGRGLLRFGSDGGVPLKPLKPVPIFKGHFGGKGYPLLRGFSQENDVFVYFSDEMGENI